jgi:IS5 family transposase
LEALRLKVNEARGAIIDASITQATARPNRTLEVDARGNIQVRGSADAQARWVQKGKHYFYGYCAYAAVDTEDGFVDTAFTRPANEPETKQFKRLVRQLYHPRSMTCWQTRALLHGRTVST